MNAQIKVGDIFGYAADAKAGKPVRKIRIVCVYSDGSITGRMLDGDFLMTSLCASDLIIETPEPKLSPAMVEALRTAGRRGVARVFGSVNTLRALERRGLVTVDPSGSGRHATITDAGMLASAEIRKTSVTA